MSVGKIRLVGLVYGQGSAAVHVLIILSTFALIL